MKLKCILICILAFTCQRALGQHLDTIRRFNTDFNYFKDSIIYMSSLDSELLKPKIIGNMPNARTKSKLTYGFSHLDKGFKSYVLKYGNNTFVYDTNFVLLYFDIRQANISITSLKIAIGMNEDRIFNYLNLYNFDPNPVKQIDVYYGFAANGIYFEFKRGILTRMVFNHLPD